MTSLVDLIDLVVYVHSPDWNCVQELIRSNKDLIKRPLDRNVRYLLHHACWKNAPSELVIQLINDYPEACEVMDITMEGYIPLHYACEYNQSVSVIESLITTYPNGIKEISYHYGMLPLHIACKNNQSKSVIQLLISSYPQACEERIDDEDKYLPLHL